jgi:hypothetical protein
MSLADVLSTLNTTTTLVASTELWFTNYFGIKGIVVLNGTVAEDDTVIPPVVDESGSSTNASINVPAGLEDIVVWISQQVKLEVSKQCVACNQTNGTLPDSGEGETEVPPPADEGNATWSSFNYTLPDFCAYTDSTNMTVFCRSGQNAVLFNLTTVNEWWNATLPSKCSVIQSSFEGCSSDASPDQCFRMDLYNQFQMDDTKDIYAWLSFD